MIKTADARTSGRAGTAIILGVCCHHLGCYFYFQAEDIQISLILA
jgi:hypothetical protein